MYTLACEAGTHPTDFWYMTLQENMLIINHARKKDKEQWNHTSTLMALYANSKASKGKRYSPDDFNPYIISEKKAAEPKSKEDVNKLITKYKSFNG